MPTNYVKSKIRIVRAQITKKDFAAFKCEWNSFQEETKKAIVAVLREELLEQCGFDKLTFFRCFAQVDTSLYQSMANLGQHALVKSLVQGTMYSSLLTLMRSLLLGVINQFSDHLLLDCPLAQLEEGQQNLLKTLVVLLQSFKFHNDPIHFTFPLDEKHAWLVKQLAVAILNEQPLLSCHLGLTETHQIIFFVGKKDLNLEDEENRIINLSQKTSCDLLNKMAHVDPQDITSALQQRLCCSLLEVIPQDLSETLSQVTLAVDDQEEQVRVVDEQPKEVCLFVDGEQLLVLFRANEFIQLTEILQKIHEKQAQLIDVENYLPLLAQLMLEESLQGVWTIKDRNRIQEIYLDRDATLNSGYLRQEQKLELAQAFFRLINPELYQQLARDEYLDRQALTIWYQKHCEAAGRFFSYDPSDDSDSDDENQFKTGGAARYVQFRRIKKLHTPEFWCATRRSHTGGRGSLHQKAKEIACQETIDVGSLSDVLKRKLKARAALPNVPAAADAKPYVAFYRGINYLPDRWDKRKKRRHFYTDETHKPQYCEAALMAVGDLYQDPDFKVDIKASELESASAEILSSAQTFAQTGPCIAYTVKPRSRPYIFNSFSDYLQHCYSNGISQHLITLANCLQQRNEWLVSKFKNAYNYAISTGDRPYHALRYALGLKDYYEHAVEPAYDQNGSIENFHAGKLYIFLFTKEEFLKQPHVHRVTQMILEGKCPIDYNISSEVETAFIGKIDGDQVVAQFALRFPSFDGPYKEVFEIKYGLDKTTYDLFKELITETAIGSQERKSVINLLKEWLCAYYEVLAIKFAQKLTQEKKGRLVYLDAQGEESQEPPLRPFTSHHIDTQNQAHVLQNTRWLIGEKIAEEVGLKVDDVYFPDLDLCKRVAELRTDDEFLSAAIHDRGDGETVKLTEQEESELFTTGSQDTKRKKDKVQAILLAKQSTFFAPLPTMREAVPRGRSICSEKVEKDTVRSFKEVPLVRQKRKLVFG